MRRTAALQRVAMSYCRGSPRGARRTRQIGRTCLMPGLEGAPVVQNPYYPVVPFGGTMGSMTSQRDYCPIAVGVDVLGDRWTPLVIRELMVGAAASAGPCSSSGFATSSAAGS